MPGSLQLASPTSVFPSTLSTSFSLSVVYPVLATTYQDGTIERSMIVDGVNSAQPLRVWRLTKRLNASNLATLLTFWETTVQGGFKPFYFYDPFQPFPGNRIGSNYDATGVSTQGRVVCKFNGSWSHSVQLGRADIPSLELVEVA